MATAKKAAHTYKMSDELLIKLAYNQLVGISLAVACGVKLAST